MTTTGGRYRADHKPLLLQFINHWSKVNPLCCCAVLGAGECSQRFAFAFHLVVLSREQDSGLIKPPAHAVILHTQFTPMDDRNSVEGEDTGMFAM